jgi:hypothetical protein
MKPKSLAVWGVSLTLIGLIALATGCTKSPSALKATTLPPIGVTSDQEATSIPNGTSTGTGYQVIFDQYIYGATTTAEVTEWAAYVGPAEHNTVEIAVENGYVCVGGGAHTVDPNGNQANVDALLTAAYPVVGDGYYSSFVASNKDQFTQYFSYLYVYVIGLKLYGPGGTVIPTSAITPHLYETYDLSTAAHYPTVSEGVPSQYANRILSGGAFDDYGSGYGNLITECDWTLPATTTAAGKDQHSPDVCSIYDFVIAIDNNPIAGFGNLNVAYNSATIPNSTHLQSLGVAVAPGYGLTGVGGKTTWTGYGRMLYDLYAPSSSQIVVGSKDQQTPDISGNISGIVSGVQPAQ